MTTTPDTRMVKCVLDGYEECPVKVPEVCICYQMQQTPSPVPGFHNMYVMYEERYIAKYGEDRANERT